MLARRALFGFGLAALAMPAIVRASSIMGVVPIPEGGFLLESFDGYIMTVFMSPERGVWVRQMTRFDYVQGGYDVMNEPMAPA